MMEKDTGTPATNPKKLRRLAYKSEDGYVSDDSVTKTKKRIMKVASQSKPLKKKKKRKKRCQEPQRKVTRPPVPTKVTSDDVIDGFETTWLFLVDGRKIIEETIQEGKIQVVKALRQNRRNNENRRRRAIQKRLARYDVCKETSEFGLSKVNPSSSSESGSIQSESSTSGSNLGSLDSSSFYSEEAPSILLSESSSTSQKKDRLKASPNLNTKADKSFDSLGENSIIADDGSPTEQTVSTLNSTCGEMDDDESSIISLWSAFKKLVTIPESDAKLIIENETKPRRVMEINELLKQDSYDSWMKAIQTGGNGSFSTALDKELDYHRQMSNTSDDVDNSNEKSQERKPTLELSDAEFLKVVCQNLEDKARTKTLTPVNLTGEIMETKSDLSETVPLSATTSNLSNADFLKALRKNGVEDDCTSNSAPVLSLSNEDSLKPPRQDRVEVQGLKPMKDKGDRDLLEHCEIFNGKNEVDEGINEEKETVDTNAGAYTQDMLLLSLSDDLSNADFLNAMKQSLSVNGGNFETGTISDDDDMRAKGVEEVDKREEINASTFSNAEFLHAMRQTTFVDGDSMNQNSTPSDADANSNLQIALRQMKDMSPRSLDDEIMFSPCELETIQEVESIYSKSSRCSCATSDITETIMNKNNSPSEAKNVAEYSNLISKEQPGQTSAAEVLVTKPVGNEPYTVVPDLTCVSSDESDTHFDPQPERVGVNDVEKETVNKPAMELDLVDYSCTGFMTADEIDAEDSTNFFSAGEADTQFFSVLTGQDEADEKTIENNDSLNDILCDRKEEHKTATLQTKIDSHLQQKDMVECRQDEALAALPQAEIIGAEKLNSSLQMETCSKDCVQQRNAITTNDANVDTMCVKKESCNRIAPENSRMEINKAIGKKVIQGWKLLDSFCPHCTLPLMTDINAAMAMCISCDYFRTLNEVHGPQTSTLAPPPPPPMSDRKAKKTKRPRMKRTQVANRSAPVKVNSSSLVFSE